MATEDSLIELTAREAVVKLNTGEVSPLELIDAVLARHEAVDGAVNALPTICAERAREHAHKIMEANHTCVWVQGGSLNKDLSVCRCSKLSMKQCWAMLPLE